MNHKPFFLLTPFVLFLFSSVSYCLPYPFTKEVIPNVDMAMFQASVGWADFKAPGATLNILDPAPTPFDANFNASGVHIALNLSDFKRIPNNWFLGGRIGAQIFSNLKSTTTIPITQQDAPNETNLSYELKLPGGFFGDALVIKTFKENQFYLLGFGGVGYDRYQFQGYQNYLTGLPAQIRNNRMWAAGARAGAGAGIQLKGNIMTGIEYTHRFDQSLNAKAITGNYPFESRNHSIAINGNSVDLVFVVALYD